MKIFSKNIGCIENEYNTNNLIFKPHYGLDNNDFAFEYKSVGEKFKCYGEREMSVVNFSVFKHPNQRHKIKYAYKIQLIEVKINYLGKDFISHFHNHPISDRFEMEFAYIDLMGNLIVKPTKFWKDNIDNFIEDKDIIQKENYYYYLSVNSDDYENQKEYSSNLIVKLMDKFIPLKDLKTGFEYSDDFVLGKDNVIYYKNHVKIFSTEEIEKMKIDNLINSNPNYEFMNYSYYITRKKREIPVLFGCEIKFENNQIISPKHQNGEIIPISCNNKDFVALVRKDLVDKIQFVYDIDHQDVVELADLADTMSQNSLGDFFNISKKQNKKK